jgi:hypothetical protein
VRPKYVLWIVVAVVSSVWYMVDPEASHSISPIIGRGTGGGPPVTPGSVGHSTLSADPVASVRGAAQHSAQ